MRILTEDMHKVQVGMTVVSANVDEDATVEEVEEVTIDSIVYQNVRLNTAFTDSDDEEAVTLKFIMHGHATQGSLELIMESVSKDATPQQANAELRVGMTVVHENVSEGTVIMNIEPYQPADSNDPNYASYTSNVNGVKLTLSRATTASIDTSIDGSNFQFHFARNYEIGTILNALESLDGLSTADGYVQESVKLATEADTLNELIAFAKSNGVDPSFEARLGSANFNLSELLGANLLES